MKNKHLSFSFVIPTFNDTLKLYESLKYLQKFLSEKYLNNFEVIIVNDGGEFIDNNRLVMECRIINLPKNLGKGGAVSAGVEYAKKEYIVIVDSDIPFYLNILLSIEKNDVCLFSNRFYKTSVYHSMIPLKRKCASYIFKFLIYLIFRIKEDTQCGYKVYKNELCKAIYKELSTKGYAFDVEATLLVKEKKIEIKEFDVQLREYQHSRISLMSDVLPMLKDTANIYTKRKK